MKIKLNHLIGVINTSMFVLLLSLFVSCNQTTNKTNESSSSSTEAEKQTIKYVRCGYCSNEFNELDGYALSARPSLKFCSTSCTERYAFENEIMITNY